MSVTYGDRSTLASCDDFTPIVTDEAVIRAIGRDQRSRPQAEPIQRFVANPSASNRPLYHVPVHCVTPSITLTRAKYVQKHPNIISINFNHFYFEFSLTQQHHPSGETEPLLDTSPSAREVPNILLTTSLTELTEEEAHVTEELGEIKRTVRRRLSELTATSSRDEVLPVISDFVQSICQNSVEQVEVERSSNRRLSLLDLTPGLINGWLGALGSYSSYQLPTTTSFTDPPCPWLEETERYGMLGSDTRSPRPMQMAC